MKFTNKFTLQYLIVQILIAIALSQQQLQQRPLSKCECKSSTVNGRSIECVMKNSNSNNNDDSNDEGVHELPNPICIANFQQANADVIRAQASCTDDNVFVTDGEYTGPRRKLNISCTAPYPLDVDYDGMLPHRSIRITFSRFKSPHTDSNYITSVVGITMTIEPEITGNYIVYNINDPSKSTSFYIYAKSTTGPYLLYSGQAIPPILKQAPSTQQQLILPCRPFQPNQRVRLRALDPSNSGAEKLNEQNIPFDPKIGFTLERNDNTYVTGRRYECSTPDVQSEGSSGTVIIEIGKENFEIEISSEDQGLTMNVTKNWVVCETQRKDIPSYRIINMRATNPSEARLKKKCLEGDNECIGKREGGLNLCYGTRYCKTVDFKDGGGILTCFVRAAKTFPEPLEYLYGLDKDTYLNPVLSSLPTKAILSIEAVNHVGNFYSDIPYKFICRGSRYILAEPLEWVFEFKNGSNIRVHTGNTGEFTIEDARSNPPSFDNYKIEHELVFQHELTKLVCQGYAWNSDQVVQMALPITVDQSFKPKVLESHVNVKLVRNQGVSQLVCDVVAKPPPIIEWKKNGEPINRTRTTTSNSTLYFSNVMFEDAGIYTCVASNRLGSATKYFTVHVEEPESMATSYWITIGIPIMLVIIATIITLLLLKYYRKNKKGLSKQEIDEFRQGGQQPVEAKENDYEAFIQCMPYPEEYEVSGGDFKIDNDSILGSGAYGMVFKGICSGQNVAIKTLKKYSELSYLRSLLSELKVMIYLKEHANIVNLIGANTQNLEKGLLYVFVELCPFGSLEKYLRANRQNFVENVRQENDYANTPRQDLLKNTASEYANKTNSIVSTITMEDLINWSAQVASGMDYVSNKHVIHGDLACRNLLLCNPKLVKISDFGLSRKVYEYSDYVKKSQEPLPWRHMALESLRDLTFSSKSDVWAYGVTIWEIFSLGETPYPGLSWNLDFVDDIEAGLRMKKPKYSSDELYQTMLQCWENDPGQRPTFSTLYNHLVKIIENNENNDDD